MDGRNSVALYVLDTSVTPNVSRQLGVVNGIPYLDSMGLIPTSFLPATIYY